MLHMQLGAFISWIALGDLPWQALLKNAVKKVILTIIKETMATVIIALVSHE